MNSFLIYITQVSICLSAFYLIYCLFFKKLSFHGFNRGLLVFILISSFVIPQLEISFHHEISKEFTLSKFEDLPFSEPVFPQIANQQTDATPSISVSEVLFGFYLIGLIFCVAKLVYSVSNLLKLRSNSPVKSDGEFMLVSIKSNAPFSFFRWIYLPTDLYINGNLAIVSHEKAHGKLWHSADLLLLELAKVILWFNPIIYLLRKSLKSIHEFQADSRVLENEISTSDYLTLLLQNIQRQNSVGLHSYFQNSQLKQRIEMMTNPKSRKTQLAKYLLIVPIAIFMVIAFSKGNRQQAEAPSLAFIGDQQFIGMVKDNTKPSIPPIEKGLYKKVSSEYGYRYHPIHSVKKFHTGMDFSADFGVKIQSTADGVVVKVEKSERGYGKRIVIDHGNGILTSYSQMSKFNVKLGDRIKKRDVIGFVGSSGTSTGPHLHYEVIVNGKKVNPKDYITDDDC